ncbi:MAG: putative transporter [Pelotomaculum sp. PtaB.Bin013]|uniref:MFS transporter n=1 Tax=Pelotomaculum isophthalicicum JI TaxID=947010 RepID=A0A9X4GYZ9_9FIRM|nr:MFS transporter [Pelotomaculum isophthalicicum]MDF9408255.1 MFS transporter [Pelotomaculum isophthalicicum JI]OPX91863.1 MAG: putative transporter [Pelotomaculum sp. PtaB.Bin013]
MDNEIGEEQSRLWLFGLVNFFLSFAIQGSIIFIPLLGAQLGASDFQVGLVGAAYGAAFLISSLLSGWKSDSTGRLLFVRWGLLISSAAFAAQLLADNVFILMATRGAVGFALGITTAATIAYAFESGVDMGKYSSYGSLGWIFSALAAAVVGNIDMLFLLSFLVCLLAFFLSLAFRETPPLNSPAPPNLWEVARRGHRVYLAVFLRHLGATAVWIILPLYMVSVGMDQFWIGILWGVNFAVQFIVMRYLEQFSEYKVFAIGQVLSVIVFVAFAFASGRFSLIVVQALLGVAWSCLYVGALLIILKSGEERGTAGGIFQSTLNLCNAVGPLLGGLIAQGWGYRGVMFFAAALGVVGMLVAVPAGRETADS